jgi:hypothetical protein
MAVYRPVLHFSELTSSSSFMMIKLLPHILGPGESIFGFESAFLVPYFLALLKARVAVAAC